MPLWNNLTLQEANSIPMEMLSYFHDYMMMMLILVLSFVTYMFIYVMLCPFFDSKTTDSHFLETIWTVAPMVILIFMAFPSLYLLYLMEEVIKPLLSVKVIGHQWYWEYQYANSWFFYSFDSYMSSDLSSILLYSLDVDNRLVLPVLSNIFFLITSSDVLHSWTVPSLGIKIDAIPGRLNYLTTKGLNSGVYYGQCSEICGSNHSFMPIVIEFVSMSNFLSYISLCK